MIDPPLRAPCICPKRLVSNHFSKLWSSVRPRVSVTSPALKRPGSFLITNFPSAVFIFSSMTSCSSLRSLTSSICLMTTPSISRPKEWPTDVSASWSGMGLPSRSGCGLRVGYSVTRLVPPENWRAGRPELLRLDRSHSDLADDLAGGDPSLLGLSCVALDVEGLIGRQPEQRTLGHSLTRAALIVRRMRAHSASSSGSRRTHCVPTMIDSLRDC